MGRRNRQGIIEMATVEAIQRVSRVARYVLLALTAVMLCLIAVAMFTAGQDWVILGDGQFGELWRAGETTHVVMLAIAAPVAVTLLLGVYWLQRLFGEYQSGHFFTSGTMRCYVWLVWLKAISFVYLTLWPMLLAGIAPAGEGDDTALVLDVSEIVELFVLLLIVHVLREAQRINDENQAFV